MSSRFTQSFKSKALVACAVAAVAGSSLTFSSASLAAGTVEYEVTSGKERARMTLQWRDASTVRMDMGMPAGTPAGMQAWQLLRDGKIYSVNVQNGKPMVMEMSGMMKMMGGMVKEMSKTTTAGNDVQEFHSLKPTGRSETVAGVNGKVYLLDYRPAEGERKQVEVVLSDDRAVREVTAAMNSYGRTMLAAMGMQAPDGSRKLQGEIDTRNLGMLRFGTELKAIRVSSSMPAEANFRLPAEPTAMPNIPGLGAGGLAAILGQKAERQQGRVEAKVEQEADAATDRTVDKVIENALGKLFGR